MTSTNFKAFGSDLSSIFQIYYNIQADATGYTVNGDDLNTYYEKMGGGGTASTTDYKVSNADLKTIFAGRTYTLTGTYTETVNTDSGTKYIVVCFGDTTSNVTTTNTITFTDAPTSVNYWIVGGGGGGGGTSSAYTIGAGGGGAGSILSGTFNPSNTTYTVVVGKGGSGGTNAANNGDDGIDSSVIGGSVSKTASGGKGGECASNGSSGGAAGTYNNSTSIGAGGNGAKNTIGTPPGDGGSGESISITIPSYSTNYSGGGGGGGNSYSGHTLGGIGGSSVGGAGGDYVDLGYAAVAGAILSGSGGGGAAQPYPESASGLTRSGARGGSGVVYLWFTSY